MLIEMHLLQNHSPANLNRDDLGAPKTCVFGGVTRARISSQCLKRSIRKNEEFKKAMERDGGIRTRRLISMLAEGIGDFATKSEKVKDFIAKAFEKGGVKRTGEGQEPDNTSILMFVPRSTLERMMHAAAEAWEEKSTPDSLSDKLAEILGEKTGVPDMALCGRMTELDSKGLFAKIDFHVEAALSAAHAISTHAVVNETDYFTAVDDQPVSTGAGHVDEALFNSACFYKYFSIDWDQLRANLNDDADLALLTLQQFLMAATLSTPSGKKNSFAPFNPPDGVLVEIKKEKRIPISYANAFADPVPQSAERGLVGESIARLGQFVQQTAVGYAIPAERYWFSPGLRYAFPIDGAAKPGIGTPASEAVEVKQFGRLEDLAAAMTRSLAGN